MIFIHKERIISILLLLFLLVSIDLFDTVKGNKEDEYSDDYYYETDEDRKSNTNQQLEQQQQQLDEYEAYEDDGSQPIEVDGNGRQSAAGTAAIPEEITFGFHRNVGSGLMKIQKYLVDEEYLNRTRDYYDCLKLEDLIVPIVEANIQEEVEVSIDEQVANMKNKLEKAMKSVMKSVDGNEEIANDGSPEGEKGNKNATASNTNSTTASDSSDNKKRLSFREKQALRTKERQEKEAQRELVKPKYRLGSDCETLICGSCKAVVEEFGYVVGKAVADPNIKYIDQLTQGFCSIKQINLKYKDIVIDMCKTFDQDELGYKESLIRSYEEHDNWNTVALLPSILEKQQKVCLAVGACEESQFEFQDTPVSQSQEQWNSSCFVCQAFAKNLEERIHLSRFLTESTIIPLVVQTCDRLRLAPQYDELCRKLIKGKLLDDIAWLAKVHEEGITKKAKAELRFPDKLCEEIDWCQPWVHPEQLKEKEIRKSLEPVYF